MQKIENIKELEHERWLEFSHAFGNEGFFEDGIILAVDKMASLCGIMFGEDNASAGFTRMVAGIFEGHSKEEDWSTILDVNSSSIYSETPGGQLLHDLTAYADYGIVLAATRDNEQREQLLATQVQTAERLLELLPVERWNLSGEYLIILICKASTRWKLDNDKPVTARELALLSGRALQTIKNKLSGRFREIIGTEKCIEAREANAWLSVQKDFKASIWRHQNDEASLAQLDRGYEGVMFLPVAKDGSVFHPGVRREGKYLIDEEGREREFEDFEEALEALQLMMFPQWRRPTEEGGWTRVRSVEWRRYSALEVTQMAAVLPETSV